MTDRNRFRQGRIGVPAWVRELAQPELHALAGSLRRRQHEVRYSDKQSWLLDRCLAELEYRRSMALTEQGGRPCTCDLCFAGMDAYWGYGPQTEDRT